MKSLMLPPLKVLGGEHSPTARLQEAGRELVLPSGSFLDHVIRPPVGVQFHKDATES